MKRQIHMLESLGGLPSASFVWPARVLDCFRGPSSASFVLPMFQRRRRPWLDQGDAWVVDRQRGRCLAMPMKTLQPPARSNVIALSVGLSPSPQPFLGRVGSQSR
eukprot:2474164-Pyramimonas_sp.AAC.1